MPPLQGNNKQNTSFLRAPERALVRALTPHVPQFFSSRVLTMLSMAWAGVVVWASYQAAGDIRWLWLASAMLALHWLTDCLDGAVGRYRSEGFVAWGFYMDHMLDFMLACAVFIGYAFLVGSSALLWLFVFFAVFAIIPVSIFLSFSGYNALKIGSLGFGPTEYRLAIILLNTYIIYFGVPAFQQALPYLVGLLGLYVVILVYRTQKDMYRMDMRNKK